MRRHILLTVLLSLYSIVLSAQNGSGNISAGMSSATYVPVSDSVTYIRNTNGTANNFFRNGPNQQYGLFTNDVFYSFDVSNSYRVRIINNNQLDTRLWLFTYNGGILNVLVQADGDDGIDVTVQSGHYYVVTEGLYSNGVINTSFYFAMTGDKLWSAFDLGSFAQSISQERTFNTGYYTDQYGHSTNDTFHKFTLTGDMMVTITHDRSTLDDTYMSLLDSNGNLIESNNDYDGESHCSDIRQSFIQRQLQAGTYYVVSEGNISDGIIRLNVIGNSSPDFGYTSIPSTYSTAPGTVVGGMGGQASVSPTGGAIYSIPIETPQGIGGMQPQLALVYNSQSGNGLCGFGANLSGFSSISRGPRDIFHDTVAQGIRYDIYDALYLDGKRLILTFGTAGQEGVTYKPESDPFTDVILHYEDNQAPNTIWFEVQGKDGMVYWYKARQIYAKDGIQKVHSWFLSRAIQPTGNYIDYEYGFIRDADQSCLFVYPTQITYGSNINQTSGLVNTIEFSYENRNDLIPVRFEGKQGSVNKRLRTITCKTNGNVYRTYTLDYDTMSDGTLFKYSRLISVTERNRQGESLPTTEFDWSYLPSLNYQCSSLTVQLPDSISLSFPDQTFVAGDLNNDGLTDIAGFTQENTVGSHQAHLYIYWAEKNGSQVSFTNGQQIDIPVTYYLGGFSSYFAGSCIGDWNGDGYNELFLPYLQEIGGQKTLSFCIRGVKPDGSVLSVMPNNPLRANNDAVYTLSDIDNNGRTDIVVVEKMEYQGSYVCRLLTYDPVGGLKWNELHLSMSSAPRRIYLTDMNSNGLNDLLVVCENNYTVYWNQGGSIESDMYSDTFKTTSNVFGYWKMTAPGDFNGDGLLDFLTTAIGSSAWQFFINNGDGTFNRTDACTLELYYQSNSIDNGYFHCDIWDFDGDGRDDAVITKTMIFNVFDQHMDYVTINTHTYWMNSTGTRLTESYHATSNSMGDGMAGRFLTGDFDGDGIMELVNYGYNCLNSINSNSSPTWRIYKRQGLTPQTGKVVSVKGDYGSHTTIGYSTLTDSLVYTPVPYSSYPVNSYTFPLNVVKTMSEENGAAGDGVVQTSYSYSGLRAHLTGKGLLGFTSTQVVNSNLGSTVNSEITGWDNTFYVPVSTRITTTVGGYTSQSVSYISMRSWRTNNYVVYRTQTTETDFDGNTVTTTIDYQDNSGCLIRERVDYGPYMYRMTEYQNYTNNKVGGAYRPQRIVTTQLHNNDSYHPFSQVTEYSYDNRGLVIQTVSNAQAPNLELTTNSTYDLWGNLTSQVSSGTGVGQCTTYYTYDATHRFPVRVYTNPSSSVSKYTYDLFGNVLTERDSINTSIDNTVTHTYDGWGNRILSEIPGSGVTTVTSGWGSEGSMCYYILEQGTASPWVKTWYDSKGRVVRTESVGAHDISLIGTASYDSKGRKIAETETTGSQTLSHSYSYDARGRLVSETHPGCNTITYSYFKDNNGNNKTVNDNGRATTYTYDAMGNLKAVESPGYSTLWNWYYSNGNISSAESDGATWEFDYDACGNRTSMTDPDAGTSYYVYDALGREIERIDARGVVFVTDYDYLGRVTSMTAGNETTTYTYGTSGTGQMRLTSETDGYWTKSYVYDGLGRVTQETIRNNGLNYTRSMSYHYDENSGLLTRQDYPGSKSVDYSYDVYGNCTSVNAQNGELVWSLTGNTGNSTVSTVTLGNATPYTRTTQMDNIGSLQSCVMTRGSQTIQNDSYVFDPLTGNLLSRTLTGHPVETFTYDNLDRLTCIESPGQTDIDISYYVDGSIAAKSDFGSYTYRTDKRHAVDNIDLLNGTSVRDQYIYYNDWNMMEYIEYTDADNDNYDYDVEYGPDRERVMSWLYVNYDLYCRKFYWGDYEECEYSNGEIVRNYWIGGGDGLAGLLRTSTTGNTAQTSAYVAMTDHLGSLTGLYDGSGNQAFGASYDAWGKRTVTAGSLEIERGFTGHEHLDDFGLINMNGRMYDPLQGRFLSPDPFVQAPQNPQNYNRYSYCLNNPLKYTDPSGEFFTALTFICCPCLLPIGIAVDIGWMQGAHKAYSNPDVSQFKGACMGALSGLIGGTLSYVGGGYFANNIIWGSVEGSLTSMIDACIWDENIEQASINGAIIGGLFAFFSYLHEAAVNKYEGYGFRTNKGAIRHLLKEKKYSQAVNLFKMRYNLLYA